MSRVAFATWRSQPDLTIDDRLVVEPLSRLGIEVEGAVWSSVTIAWDTYDAVVLRSTWDYHVRAGAFGRWLDRLEGLGVRVFNSPGLVRWNLDKRYLAELERRGVPVEPTVWLNRGERADLGIVLAATGWEEAVIKPTVSASAHRTWRTSPGAVAADQAALEQMLSRSGVMVQRLNRGIATAGEWSLVFLGDTYSHAVVKMPAEGEFRVQEKAGGTLAASDPSPSIVHGARAALEAALEAASASALAAGDPLGDGPLYARVDGVPDGERLVVMEIELIEPSLYLGAALGAPERFAAALAARLDPGRARPSCL